MRGQSWITRTMKLALLAAILASALFCGWSGPIDVDNALRPALSHDQLKGIGRLLRVDPAVAVTDWECSTCKILFTELQNLFLKNATDEKIMAHITEYCIRLKIEDKLVCTAIVIEFKDEVLSIFDQVALGPNEVCGILLGPSCGDPYNPWNQTWIVKLPPTPKPPVVPVPPPKPGSPVSKVLYLSDIHFDKNYTAGLNAECGEPLCCRPPNGPPPPGKRAAGPWGDYNCDCPLQTLENLLQHVGNMSSEFDWVYITGDLPPHNVWNQTQYLIKHKRMPEPDARKKFRQIVEAVDYCHKRGIVHRDLKAENLLLDSEDCVKLADFGFSNYYMKDELLKTFCGSPPYAAPELFEGTSYSGPQADIWSLGVVLYVLVCGAVLFDGHNLHSLKARVLDGRFRIPFYMSQECEKLICRMLVTNPAKRQSLSKVLTHKWMVAEGKGRVGGGEGEPKKELECRLQVYDETTGAVHWCEPVLSVIQQMGLDVNEVKRAVEERAYNDPAAVYYMLLEQWSKGRLIARRPSLPTMLQTPRIVIDPSTNTQHTLLGGSALMEGGVFGPGEELRRSPIEITGPDPTVGAFLAGRRQTIVGIPPTPEQLQHLSHLAEQAQQQGGGGTEGGREVDGSASGLGATPNMIVQNESMHPQPLHHRPPQSIYSALGIPTPPQSGGVGRNSRIARRRVSDGAWKLAEYQQMMQVRHTNANQLAMIVGSGQMSGSITASGGLDGSGSMRQIKEDYHKLHAMQKPYGRLPQSRIAYKPVMNLTQVDPQSLHSIMCGVGGVQGISGGVPHASGNLSDLATPMSLQQQLAQSQKSPPHPAGPPPDLQSQLRPFQGLAPHDLQRQLQQLNISQRSGDTSPERQESPTQGHLSGRVSPNSGNSSRKSSFGGPSPAQQPLMGQFMGAHQPIVGASGSGTRIGVAQPTPMASILSQQQSKLPNQFSPVTKDAHRKLHSTRSNPVASSDVMRPSNLIQQTPYLHHPSILYGTPPGIASGPFVSPLPVVPAVVAPPLQTQLHHGCGMVVSHGTPNGNPVNCQNNMESQAPPSPEAYLSAAGCQLEAVLTAIGLSHHRVSPSEFLVQGNSTVLKIVLSQTSNGHINLEPLHTQGDVHVFQTIIREISSKLVQPSAV